MFDIAPSEFLLVAFVALVVIGPKDLPKAMRVVGYWVGKARGVARQFRSGFDSMVREAELEEMEKRWATENERIMREHPQTPSQTSDSPVGDEPAAGEDHHDKAHQNGADHSSEPVMVEKPVVAAADHVADTPHVPAVAPQSPDLFDATGDAPRRVDTAGKPDTAKSDVAPS